MLRMQEGNHQGYVLECECHGVQLFVRKNVPGPHRINVTDSAVCHAVVHHKHLSAKDVFVPKCIGDLEIISLGFLAPSQLGVSRYFESSFCNFHLGLDRDRWMKSITKRITSRGPAAISPEHHRALQAPVFEDAAAFD